MQIAYRLSDDPNQIAQVQKATVTTDDYGIEPTDGLFGSPEWWDRIANGELPLHRLRGTITERFLGSQADWPMIRVLSDAGEKTSWTRDVNRKEQDALYRAGRRIEIDYVLQHHRGKSAARDPEHKVKVVVEIRVEPDAEGDAPGVYEKLRANEAALQVLTVPYLLVLENSYELADLGRTPGVMPADLHQVFLDARSEVESLIGGPQITNSEERKQFDRKIADLEARWKDKVIAACRKLLDESVRD